MEIHTFPLAGDEARKLDNLGQTLENETRPNDTRDFLLANSEIIQWTVLGLFAGLGVLCVRKVLSRIL